MMKVRCKYSIFLFTLIACTSSDKREPQDFHHTTVVAEKIHKKIIRRRKVRNPNIFSETSPFQDQQKYLEFLQKAIVSSEDWDTITKQGPLHPVYSLEDLEGIYFGSFFSPLSSADSSFYLEIDANHARFLPQSTDRLPGATSGQQNTRFYCEELFKQNKTFLEETKNAAIHNGSDPVNIRLSYTRYAPSQRIFDEVLSGQKIDQIGIKEEDFLITKRTPTTSFVSSTIGDDCSVSSFLGVENKWEASGEAGIPINMLNVYFKVENVAHRKQIRDIVEKELNKFTSGKEGYFGSKENYKFVPIRPVDPTIPQNNSFGDVEIKNRAQSLLFPYDSQERKNLGRFLASDSHPLLTINDLAESDFCVVVLPLFILGKTIAADGIEVLHIRYSPTAVRTFPKKWKIIDAGGILLQINNRDSIDVAKGMIMGSKKLMTDVFFGVGGNILKEMTPYEIRDQVKTMGNLAVLLGKSVPDDVGETAYEQVLYRALCDAFLFLGRNSGAKTISLKRTQ